MFPDVLLAEFEMGGNALNNVYVQPVGTWNDWKSMVTQLCKKDELKKRFQCVSIDTVDSAWDLCVKYICAQEGIEKLGDLPWGQGYDLAKKEFQTTFRNLTFAGYGLVFISHSTEKTFKDEKGEEYQQICPALPQRPFDIINKMVDLIGYIREIEEEDGTSKRYIFFRGDKRFFAKSRFKYIEPKAAFSYEDIVNAIYKAIDAEIAHSGGEATNDENPYTQLNFDALIEEAKGIWNQCTEQSKNEEAMKILEKVFGKPTKFSEIMPNQVKELNTALMEIKEIL